MVFIMTKYNNSESENLMGEGGIPCGIFYCASCTCKGRKCDKLKSGHNVNVSTSQLTSWLSFLICKQNVVLFSMPQSLPIQMKANERYMYLPVVMFIMLCKVAFV